MVYARLFDATQPDPESARLDLYDSQGNWYYSTHSTPPQRNMSTHWGILHQARERLTFATTEDPTDTTKPLLQGAAPLNGPNGKRLGYLLVSLYQEDLHQLLENKDGDRATCYSSAPTGDRYTAPSRPGRLPGPRTAPAAAGRGDPQRSGGGILLHRGPPPGHRPLPDSPPPPGL